MEAEMEAMRIQMAAMAKLLERYQAVTNADDAEMKDGHHRQHESEAP